MDKIFYIKDAEIILATRELASFVIQMAKSKNATSLSLQDIDSASRSFLDELYILALKNKMTVIDIPDNVKPLFEIIAKSHKDQVLYAPKLKVRISNKTFA